MGFLPETDQATTSASGQAGPSRHPLPGERLDQIQQLAMDVMAQVVPEWPNLASSMQALLPYTAAVFKKFSKASILYSMASDHLSDMFDADADSKGCFTS